MSIRSRNNKCVCVSTKSKRYSQNGVCVCVCYVCTVHIFINSYNTHAAYRLSPARWFFSMQNTHTHVSVSRFSKVVEKQINRSQLTIFFSFLYAYSLLLLLGNCEVSFDSGTRILLVLDLVAIALVIIINVWPMIFFSNGFWTDDSYEISRKITKKKWSCLK